MDVRGISTNYSAAYDAEKAQKTGVNGQFSEKIAKAEQANGTGKYTTLNGSDEESGYVAVFRSLYTDSGSKYTVYKTQDFCPENPVYKVKIWDTAGNVTERMIDASKVDPKNCDTFEMQVYAAHLKETGRGDFKETVLKAAIARAASHLDQNNSASWDYSTKINWVESVKDIMQSAYDYGDLKGYMEWKKFLSFLEQNNA